MTMYIHRLTRRLHWSECDPAGIIFFPVYARWISEGVNDIFLSNGIDPNEVTGHDRTGLPAVSLSMKFHSAPQLHEEVTHTIHVERIGGKSLSFRHEFRRADQLLMEAEDIRIWTTHTLGLPDSLKSADIPTGIRTLLENADDSV